MILDRVREHYLNLWGTPSRIIPLHTVRFHIDIYKWDASSHPEGVTMYTTVGASVLQQPGYSLDHRFEFYTGVLPDQEGIAAVLADVATFSASEQSPIGHGHTITYLEPLWPGTEMCCLLLKRSDVNMIPMLASPEDNAHVEFLSVTPLYRSEVEFKKGASVDALIEHWWRHNVRFWDPNRTPEPS